MDRCRTVSAADSGPLTTPIMTTVPLEIVSEDGSGTVGTGIVVSDLSIDLGAIRGPKGDQGPAGPEGPQGPAGPAGGEDNRYTHIQPASSDVWIIEHNLSRHPSVTVVDSAGTVIIGSVRYVDLNTVEVRFSVAFQGKAYLN